MTIYYAEYKFSDGSPLPDDGHVEFAAKNDAEAREIAAKHQNSGERLQILYKKVGDTLVEVPPRKTPKCPDCGSEDVSIDGQARWDDEAQEWSLSTTFDTGTCEACEREIRYFDWD